ncbi:amino acid adenylation domain-containing protein [Sessilibacter corallicola]
MNNKPSKQEQLRQIAERLAALPEEKKNTFRNALEEKGIDPWKLPLVPEQESSANDYALSFAQQRLWFIEQTEPGNPLYNLSFGLQFNGNLNTQAVEQSINAIVERHSVLRTTYTGNEDGEGRQRVNAFKAVPLEIITLDDNGGDQSEVLNQLAREEAQKPFNLGQDLMFRFKLIKVDNENTVGLFTIHHIAFDALSVDLLVQEFVSLYTHFCQSDNTDSHSDNALSEKPLPETLPKLSVQYSDFAQWQRQWGQSKQFLKQQEFWQNQLEGAPQRIDLPTDFPRSKNRRCLGKKCSIELPVELSDQLRQLARQQNVTLYMVLMATFNVLLSHYSRQDDICVGTSIANRTKQETQPLLGFFVNLLVMRNQIDRSSDFLSFLQQVNETASSAYVNQDFPFDKLIDLLGVERDNSTTPLFQVLFVLNTAGQASSIELPGVTISSFNDDQEIARYELTLRVTDNGDASSLYCQLEFDTDLFSQLTAESLLAHYEELFTQIAANPAGNINDYALLSDDQQLERYQVQRTDSEETAQTNALISQESSTIHARIESFAEHTPDALALVCSDTRLSYRELNDQANQLAHYLRSQGVVADVPVALLMDRSASFVVGLLAVLKAGGCYVPLDTQWPAARLQNLIDDCGAQLLLSETAWQTTANSLSVNALILDQISEAVLWANESTDNPTPVAAKNNLAYMIYTSGSTGKPKGVMIEHQQLINYACGVMTRFFGSEIHGSEIHGSEIHGSEIHGSEIHGSELNYSFASVSTVAADLGNTSIYGALAFGGCLHLIDAERSFSPDTVASYMDEHQVDVIKIVPSHLQGLLAANEPQRLLPKTLLILGGEACPNSLIAQVRQLAPELRIVNHYGPTETTVGVLTHEIPFQTEYTGSFPVGKPLPNSQTYILDAGGYLCPPGVAGELFVGGDSVARGYLGQPELTQERFIERQLHASQPAQRLYRTGDKARWLSNGDIDFLGRLDEQVKLRGYRVELGDIRTCLCEQDGVRDAVVQVIRGDVSERLVAFLVTENNSTTSADTQRVQSALEETLPPYMVPQQWLWLDSLPLTINGKLDRRELMALADAGPDSDAVEGRDPRDQLEQQLVAIWSQILRRDSVSIDDNFFELGGDSILSLQVIAKAKKAGITLTPKQLFDEQTIARLSQVAVTAQSDIEQQFIEIWSGILKRDDIDRHDNFFALGGDSILSLQVVAKARKAGLKVTPKQLFDEQTVAKLAAVVEYSESKTSKSQESVSGDVPLTPIQSWFFEADHPNKHHWNQSTIFTVKQPLDFKLLQQAVVALVKQHDSLRMSFEKGNDQWQQRYLPMEKLPAQELCWSIGAERLKLDAQSNAQALSDAIESAATEVQASLDLAKGPLIRVGYFELNDVTIDGTVPENRLMIAIHHLVVDGVSWRILLNDLLEAYQQLAQNKPVNLGEKSSSFQSWSQYLATYVKSDSLNQEVDYWKQVGSESPDLSGFNLSEQDAEKVAAINTVSSQAIVTQRLSKEDTQALLQKIPSVYRTQINDVLLTALSRMLCDKTHSDQICIEMEGHGREELFAKDVDLKAQDLSQSIGWFTSRFPVLLKPFASDEQSANREFSHSIKSVKEQLRAIPNKGIGYGLIRYLHPEAAIREQFAQHATPILNFNYLGQLDGAIEEKDNNAVDTLFGDAPETGGVDRALDSKRSHILDLTAQVSGGQLHLNWYYSKALQDQQTVEDLAGAYCEALSELIHHCLQESSGGVTPSDFPLAKVTQPQLEDMPFDWHNIETLYPLSPMQEGLLFHTLMKPGTGIYFMQERYQINRPLDEAAVVEAWSRVVDRHEVLRTSFYWKNEDQLLQVVHKKVETPVTLLDWRHMDEQQQVAEVQKYMSEELTTGFDLSTPMQLAITLIRVGDSKYQLIRSFHHILMDAWCFSLLMMDFLMFYQSLVEDKAIERPRLRPYRDYIAWLQKQDIDGAEKYWRDYLKGFNAPNSLAVDRPQSQEGVADVAVSLSIEETQQLQNLAQQCQITINTIVQGAWALLLSRYSGDNDIIFGVTVAGRPTELEGADSLIGLFINSLPLRVEVNNQASVSEWLKALFERNVGMREYEFAPLVDIQSWSELPRGESLFKSLFVFENAPIDQAMMDRTVEFEIDERTDRTHTNYPITVVIGPSEKLRLQLTYDKQLFDHDTVGDMVEHFKQLLCNLSQGANSKLSDIHMLAASDQQKLLTEWSGFSKATPIPQLINENQGKLWPQRFVEQVNNQSEKVAVRCLDQSLSYGELNQKANQIANELTARGVGRNDLVALLDERGIDLLVMIVAVLKAGAAYLPLDPKHPPQRLAKIIELADLSLVLGNAQTETLLTQTSELLADNQTVITLPTLLEQPSSGTLNDQNPEVISEFNDLAYVIFTSGSTGVPKGAMVEHLGMLNNMLGKLPSLNLGSDEVIAQTASQCFDISVWQFLTALMLGARVDIYPDQIAHDPKSLMKAVGENSVTILESVPSLIRSMLDIVEDQNEIKGALDSLRWLLPTGEALPPELARDWLKAFPQIPLMNAYGPAECSDDVAFWPVKSEQEANVSHMPIGLATDNNWLYILDNNQQCVPAGVTGELYIGGAGVGRGYLNDPERTNEVFIKNPFLGFSETDFDIKASEIKTSEIKNSLSALTEAVKTQAERLYRSGDLASFTRDGIIEYRGRKDHQVKVRGYRIELGEIENRVLEHNDIRLAAVVVKSNQHGDNMLVAYVEKEAHTAELESSDAIAQEQEQWRSFIKDTLPDYMVPSVFVVLPSLPLNANGKIDRLKLPDPDLEKLSTTEYVAPRNVHERKLVEIWKKVLKLDRIGIDDNFFELGGHSLLAIKMVHQMQREFGPDVSLAALFQTPTIRQLVALSQGEAQSQVRMLREASGENVQSPLFCIHHGGGHTLEYQLISANLDASIPVYGIQSRRLIEPNFEENSIEEMAEQYTAMIQEIQPQGPYQLLGWSLGGVLAMAMTHVLENQGEHVSFIGLIDSVHNVDLNAVLDNPELKHVDTSADLNVVANMLQMFGEEGRQRYETVSPDLRSHFEAELNQMDHEQGLQYAIDKMSELKLIDETVNTEFLKLRYRTSVHYRNLMKKHYPEKVKAVPYIWWAQDSLKDGEAPTPWHRYCEDVAEVDYFDGSHYDIMSAASLHEKISTCLIKGSS